MAFAAIWTGWVAWRALTTWKRQLEGGVQYELARRILKSTYRLRDAMKQVRDPVIFIYELPRPKEYLAAGKPKDGGRHYSLSEAYEVRWQRVVAAQSDLQAELIEAEVLWGTDLPNRFKTLDDLRRELAVAIKDTLIACDPDAPEQRKDAASKRLDAARDVLYDGLEDPDPFTQDVTGAIAPIEEFLKNHLTSRVTVSA